MKADLGALMRILTLRYDPLGTPIRHPMRPGDFVPRDVEDPSKDTETIGRHVLEDLHRKYRFQRASLSLSGGIDSRLTLSMLRKFLPDVKINCISVGFGETDDETSSAREAARLHDSDFSELMLDDVLVDLPKLIGIIGEPRWNLYHYYSFELGRKTSDVFFTGDGGDEMFGGYTFRYQKFLTLVPKGARWKAKAKLYLECHERDWVVDQAKMFGSAIRFSWEKIYQLLKTSFDNNLCPLDQVFLADFNGKLLYDWLPGNVAFARYLEMKIESVLLSAPMIKFATHVPWGLKYDPASNTGKLPLRKLLSEYEKRPNQISKKGFSVNLVSMWKSYAREKVRYLVNKDSQVVKKNIISNRWLQNTYGRLQDGSPDVRYINKMISILALEVWYRLFISKTLDPKTKL